MIVKSLDKIFEYEVLDGEISLVLPHRVRIAKGMTPVKFARGRVFGSWFLLVKVDDGVNASSYDIYDMKDVFGTDSQQKFVTGQLAESGIRFSDPEIIIRFIRDLWDVEALPFDVIEEPQETFVRNLRESVMNTKS